MKTLTRLIGTAAAIACISAVLLGMLKLGLAAAAGGAHDRARVVISQPMPHLDGDHLKTTLVEVNYGPGESSPPHSHACPVVGYVAGGAIRTQIKGEVEKIYRTGETFYEPPNGVHLVSANASATEPAKLLAYFLCDHEAPLSTNVPAGGGQ